MKKLFISLSLIAFTVPLFSATITVRKTGGDFTKISDALKAATSGDIIDVLGIYTESKLQITKSITIQGHGFESTIIQGNDVKPTLDNFMSLTQNHIFLLGNSFGGGSSNIDVKLSNMTIRNGISSSTLSRAGGISINRITGTVLLQKLKIVDNYGNSATSAYAPGGIFCVGSNLTMDKCWLANNIAAKSSSNGGGILLQTDIASGNNSSVIIRNSTISNNSCTGMNGNGGGIAISASMGGESGKNISVSIENSTIYGNSSKFNGNGIYLKSQILASPDAGFGSTNGAIKLTINHCTIANNYTESNSNQGMGVNSDVDGKGKVLLTLHNSIIAGNHSTFEGTTANNTNQPQIYSTNSFEITEGGLSNSIIPNCFNGVSGFNIKRDGKAPYNYTGIAFEKQLSNDEIPVLRISAGSKAKDFVVKNMLTEPLKTDQSGKDRVGNPDIGAFENQDSVKN